ncbi:MAG TPA: hydroxyacid dehydrogenase [Candidatus Dormibacteraeota bacterium]|jgi:phosphoglycerate dehydrogenase-like enzyme|nr:hydroxyacid dehydrogenase [Candidatus Dormibacteraeota bacterium]
MRPRAAFCGNEAALRAVYAEAERRALEDLVELGPLEEAELVLSTWGMPRLDSAFLAAAPRLRCVFYGAGSVHYFVTEESWARRVRVTSAWSANAVPVADYTLGLILVSLKSGWRQAAAMRGLAPSLARDDVAGTYGSTVGLVSMGAVGRLVRERLRPFDLHVLAHDPFLAPEEATRLKVEAVSLEDLLRRSDVVSLHTPLLPATRGLIGGDELRLMQEGATLINTSRGAIVREPELIEVLRRRPDLQAVLDVTDPEPSAPDSPLRSLPNVVLTPHIAGSIGPERRRMGAMMVDEVRRQVRGLPLRGEVTPELLARMA